MPALTCDLCGGTLITETGGRAFCKVCGIEYSRERIMEKLQEPDAPSLFEAGASAENALAPQRDETADIQAETELFVAEGTQQETVGESRLSENTQRAAETPLDEAPTSVKTKYNARLLVVCLVVVALLSWIILARDMGKAGLPQGYYFTLLKVDGADSLMVFNIRGKKVRAALSSDMSHLSAPFYASNFEFLTKGKISKNANVEGSVVLSFDNLQLVAAYSETMDCILAGSDLTPYVNIKEGEIPITVLLEFNEDVSKRIAQTDNGMNSTETAPEEQTSAAIINDEEKSAALKEEAIDSILQSAAKSEAAQDYTAALQYYDEALQMDGSSASLKQKRESCMASAYQKAERYAADADYQKAEPLYNALASYRYKDSAQGEIYCMAQSAFLQEEPLSVVYEYYQKIPSYKDVDSIVKKRFAWLTKMQGVWYCEEISTYNYRLEPIEIDGLGITVDYYTYGKGDLKAALLEFEKGVAAMRKASSALEEDRAQPTNHYISLDYYRIIDHDEEGNITLAETAQGQQVFMSLVDGKLLMAILGENHEMGEVKEYLSLDALTKAANEQTGEAVASDNINGTAAVGTKVYREPNTNSQYGYIEEGDTILVIGQTNSFYKISVEGDICYIRKSDLTIHA